MLSEVVLENGGSFSSLLLSDARSETLNRRTRSNCSRDNVYCNQQNGRCRPTDGHDWESNVFDVRCLKNKAVNTLTRELFKRETSKNITRVGCAIFLLPNYYVSVSNRYKLDLFLYGFFEDTLDYNIMVNKPSTRIQKNKKTLSFRKIIIARIICLWIMKILQCFYEHSFLNDPQSCLVRFVRISKAYESFHELCWTEMPFKGHETIVYHF